MLRGDCVGYQIDYKPIKKIRGCEQNRSRKAVLTGIFITFFLLSICSIWSSGKKMVAQVFFPEKSVFMTNALEDLTDDLKKGESLPDALESFCRSVIKESDNGEN